MGRQVIVCEHTTDGSVRFSAWIDGAEICLLCERDQFRAEVKRMRPVYEAAIEWSESFGELSKRLPPHVHKLRNAVDAALTAKGVDK